MSKMGLPIPCVLSIAYMEEKRYMISDTSKMLGIESHVLRYWEEELDIVIPRNEMGHRYYTEFHINLLRNVKKLKQQGYGLRAIKMMISDPKAMRESTKNLGKELSECVSQNVLKGMNYMMRVQDEKEEARYKRLDELLRSRQKESRKERRNRLRAEKQLAKEIQKTKKEQKEKQVAQKVPVEAPA